ncbi:MAG: hypothetical protein FJZ56_03950 [Chlamydiae bacterium]|nr:hypothetical protein [Chlamydiota bacterium]
MNQVFSINGNRHYIHDSQGQIVESEKEFLIEKKRFSLATKVLGYSGLAIGYVIGAALFIPISLTFLALATIQGQSVKEYCARYVALPSLRYNKEMLKEKANEFFSNLPADIEGSFCDIDGISGVMFFPADRQADFPHEQKWLVMMTGRRGSYELNLDAYANYAKHMGVRVLGFNWKGVGNSEAATLDGESMIQDGLTVVNKLLELGVKPENICIYAHSLGGGVGSNVAKRLQDEGHLVGFVSDRSFADARDVVRTHLDFIPGLKQGVSFLTSLWWDLEAAKNFISLKGFKGIVYSKEDIVIPYETSSLYKRVKILTGEKPTYRMRIQEADGLEAHIARIPKEVMKEFLDPFLKGEYETRTHRLPSDGPMYDINEECRFSMGQDHTSEDWKLLNPEKEFSVAKALVFAGLVTAYIVGAALIIPVSITAAFFFAITGIDPRASIAKYMMVPALQLSQESLDEVKEKTLNDQEDVLIQDDVQIEGMLDGVEIYQKSKKWIIHLPDRSYGYEHRLKEAIESSKEMQVNVLTANWKGVGKSRGMTLNSQSMVDDAQMMVEHLLKKGVKKEDIAIYGRSMSANIAVKAAKDTGVNVIADRGMKSIEDVVTNFSSALKLPGIYSFLSLLSYIGWKINATKEFFETKAFKALIHSKQDGVILHKHASMISDIYRENGKQENVMNISYPVSKKTSYLKKIKIAHKAHVEPPAFDALKQLLSPWLQDTSSYEKPPEVVL